MTVTNEAFLQNIADLLNDPINTYDAEREMRKFCGLANRFRCIDCLAITREWTYGVGCKTCGTKARPETIVVVLENCRALNQELYS